jgi:cytochrome c556
MGVLRTACVIGLILGISTLSGCRGPAQHRYEEELESAPESAQHAAHGRRLRELMRSLDRLVRERLPVTMDVETPQTMRVHEIASVALALAESAERIPDAARDLPLEEDERVEFVALAEVLREHAQRLGESATSSSPKEVQQQLEAIQATCGDCHQRFRLPGNGGDGGR